MYVSFSFEITVTQLKKALFFMCALILAYQGRAQPARRKGSANISVGIQQYVGSFLATAPKASFIRDSYSSFTELIVSRQTRGDKEWHGFNNYPEVGISTVYGNPGSRQYLGKSLSVFPFVRFPLLHEHSYKLKFRAGTGFTWIEKPYDIISNHKNTLIGSHLNQYIHLSLENEIRLSKSFYLNAGVAFTHISNGGAQLPNFGLNFPMMTAGLRYSFGEQRERETAVNTAA
ncbi:MAG: acyloxyacyl hydrolase, partial [Chitinophagaceae bacterium]